MSLTRKINAFDLLTEVLHQRNWYNKKITKQTAGNIKKRLANGELTYNKAIEALALAGWKISEPETWIKKTEL